VLREAQDLCLKHQPLEGSMIPSLVEELLDPACAVERKADFLRALNNKGETEHELAAFARALLPKALSTGLKGTFQDKALFDCCGTGGGGLNIVNLSTAIMPVLAACGVPVVKHGNRGVTKKSGSADVLESLGVQVDLPPTQVKACLGACGMAFLMAPRYHPAFQHVAQARALLAAEGRRTVFNLLGPLLNPCLPKTQLLGVFQPHHLDLFQKALHSLERERFLVVCGRDSDNTQIGEVSISGANPAQGYLKQPFQEDLGLRPVPGSYQELIVASKEESAGRIMAFLEGAENGFLRHAILMNAAVALWVQGSVETIAEGYAKAAEAVDSKEALKLLQKLITFTKKV
jgi:anthranilate phosphoribosyltransferase